MITHTGKIIEGDELKQYLAIVANDLRVNANAIHVRDNYAAHITKEQKEQYLKKRLDYANEVENGKHNKNFKIWQELDFLIEGSSVALLP